MFECCLLAGRVLCEELITLPEDSYRLCCSNVCVRPRNLKNEGAMPCMWPQWHRKNNVFMNVLAHVNKWMCTAEGMHFFARVRVCSRNIYMYLCLIKQPRVFTCLWTLHMFQRMSVCARLCRHNIHIFASNGSTGNENAAENSYTNKRPFFINRQRRCCGCHHPRRTWSLTI